MTATGASAPGANAPARPSGPGGAAAGTPYPRTPEPGGATVHTGRPSKAGRRSAAPVTPERILQAFNTWAFKREQPDSVALLTQVAAGAIQLGQPLSFVMYWGKGPRSLVAAPDIACLDYLAAMRARVRQVYEPGTAFKLIFTDTHATLNGHSPAVMTSYFDGVEAAARARDFDTCWLSELCFAAEAAGVIDHTDEPVSEETLRKLGVCATKWFRGEGTPADGAARYFQMNMVEKRSVQFAFPRSIFVTFNNSEFRCLFPDRMPIFYMYSLRRGTGVKPWFLTEQSTPATLGPPAPAQATGPAQHGSHA